MLADTVQPGLTYEPSINTSHLPAVHITALTVKQAADILQVSGRTVWTFIQRGYIPTVNYGRTTRILSDELLEFMRTGTERLKKIRST